MPTEAPRYGSTVQRRCATGAGPSPSTWSTTRGGRSITSTLWTRRRTPGSVCAAAASVTPGLPEHAFRYQAGELAAALDAVADHFSIAAMRVALNNKPVGAVRASLGYASTASDVQALVAFLEDFACRTGKG